MLHKSNFSIETAIANQSGAMDADTISKNGRSSKSQMSRRNTQKKCPFFLLFALAIILFGTSCNNNDKIDDVSNSENHTEDVNKTSVNLKEDYEAWFQLQGKYIENFSLIITEVQFGKSNWSTDELTIALVENVTDKERGGFFKANSGDYLSVNALHEVITTLENIATQIKNDTRKYNCRRLYNTSYGITITFQYSSSKNGWNGVEIYYPSTEYPNRIEPEYLMSYIEELKNCKQNILDYTAVKWSNSN